jgi:hypothetical protein
MKLNWVIIALVMSILVLGYLQIRSCRDTTATNISAAKDSIAKDNAALGVVLEGLARQDSLLQERYRLDTIRFRKVIDSLSAQNATAKARIADLVNQINSSVKSITLSVSQGEWDSVTAMGNLTSLKQELSSLQDLMHFQNDISDAKDSVYGGQLLERDSVIAGKNQTIDSLRSVITSKDAIISGLITEVDNAISQLKKKKTANVLRTIAEVAAGIALLIIK